MRDQPDVAVALPVCLDGRLAPVRGVAVEHGGDDVAVVGAVLAADHHPVTVGDRGVCHRVADDGEHHQVAVPDQQPRQRDDVVWQFSRRDRDARGDLAHHWHLREFLSAGLGSVRPGPDLTVPLPEHGGPRSAGLADYHALFFQLGKLVRNA